LVQLVAVFSSLRFLYAWLARCGEFILSLQPYEMLVGEERNNRHG
jgi:hypothetical protein